MTAAASKGPEGKSTEALIPSPHATRGFLPGEEQLILHGSSRPGWTVAFLTIGGEWRPSSMSSSVH